MLGQVPYIEWLCLQVLRMQPSYFKNIIIYYIHGRDPKLSLSVPLAGQRSQLNIDISDQWDTAFQHQDNAAPE